MSREDQVIPNARRRGKRWKANREHWSRTLDAQNLSEGVAEIPLETQIALFETFDVRCALREMKPLRGRMTLDLGGGLGLMAILLAARGATVVVADISLPRLKRAREIITREGLQASIHFVCTTAEELAFRDESFDRITCKSVLIHTDLARASAELARTLARDGMSCLIEPMARNPFVNLYRQIAAPKIWREITDYFTPRSIETVARPFRERGFATHTRYAFWLAFFASPLNYSLHWPRAYRGMENFLNWIDGMLIKLFPAIRRQCWFCVIVVQRKGKGRG